LAEALVVEYQAPAIDSVVACLGIDSGALKISTERIVTRSVNIHTICPDYEISVLISWCELIRCSNVDFKRVITVAVERFNANSTYSVSSECDIINSSVIYCWRGLAVIVVEIDGCDVIRPIFV